jgi:alkanesulfonate monooxygenase SsuD/methylene tetrahydromethanopterin reductase-like flavin-dependent oxidoreductase (luciferase family)
MSSSLPLSTDLEFGFITGFGSREAARDTASLARRCGFDCVWVGDHVAFPVPILDPFLQLAQLAAFDDHIGLGTSVYLLPLRHPVHVAKQVASLDHLSGGNRFRFGVGIGGEFPGEFAACGVPLRERGARLEAAIPLVRSLLSGEPTASESPFFPFPETRLAPATRSANGPPIWAGGRAAAALERMGRLADGWISYVVTPDRYRLGLEAIAASAERAGREMKHFGTAHLLFMRIDDDAERALDAASDHLSHRYAMDFRSAAKRYAAVGPPAAVAESIDAFRTAGVRHFILDCVGPAEDRETQLERFANEVRPLLT